MSPNAPLNTPSKDQVKTDIQSYSDFDGVPFSTESETSTGMSTTADLSPPLSSPIIDALREAYRHRTDLLNAEGNLTRQIKSLERRIRSQVEAEPDVIKLLARSAAPFLEKTRDEISSNKKQLEAEIVKRVKAMPIWKTFGEPIRGFGAIGLGQIIGVAGDLSNYSTPAKLWKRFGLAVINGGRQRKCTDADLALLHGYSPRRRSVMWTIGHMMMMKKPEQYRPIYDAYKISQKEKHPEMSDGQIDNRAHRYVQKRLLLNLWKAWRNPTADATQNTNVPSS